MQASFRTENLTDSLGLLLSTKSTFDILKTKSSSEDALHLTSTEPSSKNARCRITISSRTTFAFLDTPEVLPVHCLAVKTHSMSKILSFEGHVNVVLVSSSAFVFAASDWSCRISSRLVISSGFGGWTVLEALIKMPSPSLAQSMASCKPYSSRKAPATCHVVPAPAGYLVGHCLQQTGAVIWKPNG